MCNCRNALLVFGLLLVAGCGPGNSSKEVNAIDTAMAEEEQLLSDPNKAIPELIRRVRAAVKMHDGLLVVDWPIGVELSVLPASSPWVVKCGSGISVVFGNSVTSTAEGTDNDVKLLLAYTFVPKQRCEGLAIAIGKEIQLIQSGG